MSVLDAAVARLLERTAASAILPRFGRLAADDVETKSPGDYVTVADREAEAMLAVGLAQIDRDARVIGEEACAAEPTLLNGIARGRVWIVDPLDGTNNFADGHAPFGVLVALAEDGEVVRGWLYDPVARRLCHAVRGAGAFVNGKRVRARRSCRELPVATFSRYWLPADEIERIERRSAGVLELRTGLRCAAAQYPALVDGTHDVARFERVYPWDHAAGALFLEEAGGRITRLDGTPYRIGEARAGLLAAASPQMWEAGIAALGG